MLITLSWTAFDPALGLSHLETAAFERIPRFAPCDDGMGGTCISYYEQVWYESRAILPTETSVTYDAPDPPSGAVVFIEMKPCREDCCP